MRIIGGEYGGRTLKSVDAEGLRPTTDRVRESLFNILASRIELEGGRVLDLFAGTGALGIEALSRGAAHCTFVEQHRKTAELVRENLTQLGAREAGEIVVGDAMKYVHTITEPYDLILADPPYNAAILAALVTAVFAGAALRNNGLFVLEHSSFTRPPVPEGVALLVERTIGDSAISIFRAVE